MEAVDVEKSDLMDPNAAPLMARTEKNFVSLRLFMGTTTFAVFFIILLISAAAASYTTDWGIVVAICSILAMFCGSQVPRHPKQGVHHMTPKARQILGQVFFLCMFMLILWSVIGGFASYFFVEDFITEYCTECIKDSCGCDDLCMDEFNGLKAFS